MRRREERRHARSRAMVLRVILDTAVMDFCESVNSVNDPREGVISVNSLCERVNTVNTLRGAGLADGLG